MEIVYRRCCGLDIHKKLVVACLSILGANGRRHKETRTFGTTTPELLQLLDWLKAAGCTHIAMESTGVFWKPIYNLLEGCFELLVVNAQHIKAVPGHKTDVRDAEWIADLLQHGLLKGSFIPPVWQRELRELTRHRTNLVEDRARVVNRLHKILEDTNLKVTSVATDITGKSARAMLEALLAGETDPVVLAGLARGRMRAKRAELEQALVGELKPHHRFMIAELLRQIDQLDEAIGRVGQEIATRMRSFDQTQQPEASSQEPVQPEQQLPLTPSQRTPEAGEIAREPVQPEQQLSLTWAQAIVLLCTIPGISRRAAEGILAEIGLDMSRFPSAGHLASWAGMCPGNHESAGKRLSGRTRKGSPWLRKLLVEAAHAAAHTKNTYLSAQYHREASRRGKKKAMIAVGHSMLVIIYHVLQQQKSYEELGGNYFDERERQATEKRLVRRLEKLGYQVALQPAPQVA
jgi:transposase